MTGGERILPNRSAEHRAESDRLERSLRRPSLVARCAKRHWRTCRQGVPTTRDEEWRYTNPSADRADPVKLRRRRRPRR